MQQKNLYSFKFYKLKAKIISESQQHFNRHGLRQTASLILNTTLQFSIPANRDDTIVKGNPKQKDKKLSVFFPFNGKMRKGLHHMIWWRGRESHGIAIEGFQAKRTGMQMKLKLFQIFWQF
jgi:hypothetical protein